MRLARSPSIRQTFCSCPWRTRSRSEGSGRRVEGEGRWPTCRTAASVGPACRHRRASQLGAMRPTCQSGCSPHSFAVLVSRLWQARERVAATPAVILWPGWRWCRRPRRAAARGAPQNLLLHSYGRGAHSSLNATVARLDPDTPGSDPRSLAAVHPRVGQRVESARHLPL